MSSRKRKTKKVKIPKSSPVIEDPSDFGRSKFIIFKDPRIFGDDVMVMLQEHGASCGITSIKQLWQLKERFEKEERIEKASAWIEAKIVAEANEHMGHIENRILSIEKAVATIGNRPSFWRRIWRWA